MLNGRQDRERYKNQDQERNLFAGTLRSCSPKTAMAKKYHIKGANPRMNTIQRATQKGRKDSI